MKIEKYEIVLRGEDDTPPNMENVEKNESSTDVTLDSLYKRYLDAGHGKTAAMSLAKSEMREIQKKQREDDRKREDEDRKRRKEEREKEKEERQKEKDEREKEQAEKRYQEMVTLGMEDIYPYLDTRVSKDGGLIICHTLNNYIQVLEKHSDFAGKLNLNEFSRMDEWEKKPMSTRMMNLIGELLERKLGYFDPVYLRAAVQNVCTRHPYHPVKEVIDTLVWDRVPRVESFFVERNGGEDTPLTREMTFKWLFAMVKRIYEPGCFFDHYLVLCDSKQGTGKTGTFQRLTEGLNTSMGSLTNENISINLSDKDNVMALMDCSIGLLDESSKVKYGDKCEAFKAFMSQRTYVYRPVYGTHNEHVHIHHVIAMTTNDENFLTDSSGDFERRAWVIRCEGDPDRTPEEWEKFNSDEVIQQVWAELVYYYTHQNKAPYNITGKNVTILSSQGKEDLQKLQRQVKTSNEDFPAENAIIDIMEGQLYSKDIFFTAKDFCNDRDNFRYEEQKYTHRLDVIPANWLYEYVNKMIGSKGNRSSRYIRQMILNLVDAGKIGNWEIDNHRYYNKKQTTCWVRVVVNTDPGVESTKEVVEKKTKNDDVWNTQTLIPR